MKKTKRLAAALLAAVTTVALSACGAQTTTSRSGQGEVPGNETLKIAYIVMAKTDAFWTGMEAGAIKYADEVGVQVDFQAPEKETDVDKQVQFMENAITKGYDAIILSPADSIALAPVVKKANDAGIPDGRICYLEGIPGVQALDDRLNGFRDQCGNFSVVASQTARCDRNEGFNVMQNVLSSNPEVNVVWAVNAEMGQGAIQAIEQSDFSGRVQVFDFDAAPDDLQAIKDGTLAGTVAQYPNLQAEAAIQACLDVLDGKELPAHTKTKASLVTAENVEAFEAGEDIG